MKRILGIFLALVIGISLVIGIFSPTAFGAESKRDLILATTTSTKDSGLLEYLLPVFEKERGIKVKVLSQGTGQAIKTAEMGDCDVLLVHSRPAEDKFIASGYGVNRRDVMFNDFVIVGPVNDPAGLCGLKIMDAMKGLTSGKAKFISRGDNSGTHMKEQELWKSAGIEPRGSWYLSVGKGMGDTLVMANELMGYTLADRGTYASMKTKLELVVLVTGGGKLLRSNGFY